jgi:hypothetical protein
MQFPELERSSPCSITVGSCPEGDRGRGGPAGFPWLVIAGKALMGWVVIDMDATLVTARVG